MTAETASWVVHDLIAAPGVAAAVQDVLAPAVEQLTTAGATHRFVFQTVESGGRLRAWFHLADPGAQEAVRHELDRRLASYGQERLTPPPDRQRPPVLLDGTPRVVRWQEEHLAITSALALRMLLEGLDGAGHDSQVLSFLLANRTHGLRRPAELRARSEALVAADGLEDMLSSAELNTEFAAGRRDFVALLRGIWTLPKGGDGATLGPSQGSPSNPGSPYAPGSCDEGFWALGAWMNATQHLPARLTGTVGASRAPAAVASEVHLLRLLDGYTALMGNRLGVSGRRHRMLLALAAASVRALVPTPRSGGAHR
ncbi:hypothetical protein ACH4VR_03575 [Streptomyces sp. NPDC020883]|uniref:hypothetical protein n=1 Tax=Streptomyces sp. NPDC020883 TaxID=3365099 RepID=UPI0037BDFC75